METIGQLNMDRIDLVLLGMVMPRMGGKEAYRKVKDLKSGVKVVLTSRYTINGQVREILREGVSGFVQKPFNPEQLAQIVRQALSS